MCVVFCVCIEVTALLVVDAVLRALIHSGLDSSNSNLLVSSLKVGQLMRNTDSEPRSILRLR